MKSEDLLGKGEEIDKNPFDVFEVISKKVAQALRDSSYKTLEDLHNATDADIIATKNIGQRSVNGIRGILASEGYEKTDFEAVEIPDLPDTSQSAPAKIKKVIQRVVGGQVRSIYAMYDPNHSVSATRGQIIQGNSDKTKDFPKELVETMLERGEATYGGVS